MNRNYKVIWNASLNCFMAVAEYAKSRGKSSSGAVTSKVNQTSSIAGGAKVLRLSALCAGIALTGVSVQSIAAVNYQGDIGPNIGALGTLNVKGGATVAADLSDNNIGVISDSSPPNNAFGVKTLTIKLSKTLTGLESADFNGVNISTTGINANNTQITNVLSAGDITLPTNALNAVNVSDLNTAIATNKVKYFDVNSIGGGNEFNDGAGGTDAIAIGKNASAAGSDSIALGLGANTTGNIATAIGRSATAGYFGTAIGSEAYAVSSSADGSPIAMGTSSRSTGESSIAIGDWARATGTNAIAIGGKISGNYTPGQSTLADGERSIAIGDAASGVGADAVAFGTGSSASANNAIAIGKNSTARYADSMAIGKDSTTATDLVTLQSVLAYNPGTGTLAGATPAGEISVGSTTVQRRITNVAAGGADTDAVNVSQLRGLTNTVATQRVKYVSVKSTGGTNEDNKGATGTDAIAIGKNTSAVGFASTALGFEAQADGVNSTSLGRGAKANGNYSSALGWEAEASADNSMALGREAKATGANSIALGREAQASSLHSIALGWEAKASANNSMALGRNSEATAVKSTALGSRASANAQEGDVALGSDSTTTAVVGTSSVTINGQLYNFTGIAPKSTVSIGSVGKERTLTNLAAGRVSATSTDGINGSQLFATNQEITAVNNRAITLGNTTADGMGGGSSYDADSGTLITSLTVGGKTYNNVNAALQGVNTTATKARTTVTGAGNVIVNKTNIDDGPDNYEVKIKDDITLKSVTTGNTVMNNAGVTVNDGSGNVTSVVATGMTINDGAGNSNTSLATGNTVTNGTDTANYVASGVSVTNGTSTGNYTASGLTISDGTNTTIVNQGGLSFTDAGSNPIGPKVTAGGINAGDTVITGVTAGAVNKDSTDAINGSQLFDLTGVVAANKTKYVSINDGGGPGGNINNDAATGANAIAIGKDTSAVGANTVALGNGATGSGENSVAIGNNSVASGQQSIAIGGVQNGTNPQKTTASGNQSIAMGANTVSSGNSSIAIGGDDLNDASRANTDGSTAAAGINGGTVNTLFKKYAGKDMVDPANNFPSTEAKGQASVAFGIQATSTGDLSTAFGTRAESTGDASTALGVASSATKEGSVALGAGSKTDGSATSEKSITLNGNNYTFAGNVLDSAGNVQAGAQVSVGSIGAERQIKNLAGGAISATSTDAINGSQLHATNQALENVAGNVVKAKTTVSAGKNIVVDAGTNTDGSTNYQVATADDLDLTSVTTGDTVMNNNGIIIKNGPSITVNGIDGGGKVITGVADGIKVNDAVNIGQLNALGSSLGGAINDLGYRIDDVEDDANAGISAAMAMSSIPQSFLPGKSMIGGGIATYNGESAVAIGYSKVSDNGRWVIKVNGTADTQGNVGGAAGAGFHF